MLNFVTGVFSSEGFLPHGHCFLWTPGILWTDAISDTLIALSYYSIPLAIWHFLRRRRDVPYSWVAALFALFIFCCGTTHILDVIDLWAPLYWADTAVKAFTAVVSVTTAVVLWSIIPKLLSIPTRGELEQSNAALTKEVAARARIERDLHELNHTLEYRVRQRTAQLEKLNAELRQESAQRQRAEEQTRVLNAQLERRVADRTAQLQISNQELEAFSYSVAHDLWAPLRAIDGFSEAFLDEFGDTLSEQGHHYLQRIIGASKRMGKLIDSMLELARLTRSAMHVRPVDLSALAAAVVVNLRQADPGRDVEVSIESGMTAQADPHYMGLVLENLLDNAWKYTSKTSAAHIQFCRAPNDAEVVFMVRDNGVGFDMAFADKLFGVFQRLHASNEFPGNGVGLATVRRILSKHGGRIWAESQPGAGATFYFTLARVIADGPGSPATNLPNSSDYAPSEQDDPSR